MVSNYTDLDTVKASLGKLTVDDRDDLITAAISAACRMIDRRTGRFFYLDTVASAREFGTERVWLDGNRWTLLVDDIGDETGLATSVDGATVSSLTTGQVGAIARGRPVTMLRAAVDVTNPFSGPATVTARWGWPAVPDEIAQAAMLLSARLYRRKDSPQGVIGTPEWGVLRVGRFDPDVEALLSPYVLAGFA